MKTLSLILIVFAFLNCSGDNKKLDENKTMAARSVIQRVIPELDNLLSLEIIRSKNDQNPYQSMQFLAQNEYPTA